MTTLTHVPFEDLIEHPDNLRGEIDDSDPGLVSLSTSIDSEGLKTSLTGKYEDDKLKLTAGHRRLHAIGLLSPKRRKQRFPFGIPVMLDEAEDGAGEILSMLAENMHREDLDVVAEGEGYRMLKEVWGLTVKAIADRHGVSSAHVSRRISVAKLPEVLHQYVRFTPSVVSIEQWVELGKYWSKFPEAVQGSVVAALDERARQVQDPKRPYATVFEFGHGVTGSLATAKLAELKAKANKKLAGTPWADKPEKVAWNHEALWKAEHEKGQGYHYVLGEEVEPDQLASLKGAMLYVHLDRGANTFTFQSVSFKKRTTSEREPDRELTPAEIAVREHAEAQQAAVNRRVQVMGEALAKAKDADVLALILSACDVFVPAGRALELLRGALQVDPATDRDELATRLKTRAKSDLLRMLAIDLVVGDRINYYPQWTPDPATKITNAAAETWPPGFVNFVSKHAGVDADPMAEWIVAEVANIKAEIEPDEDEVGEVSSEEGSS